MAKLPALYLMTGDWMKNPELRRCSPGARGVWIDMMCLMFDCETRGVLATGGSAWSPKEIANVVSGDTNLVVSHIEELLQKHVARMDDQSGSQTGVASAIYSGRMIRDEKERQRWQQSKQTTRAKSSPADCPVDVPPNVPPLSRPLSPSLTPSIEEEPKDSPTPRPEDFANSWNNHRGMLPKVKEFTDSRRKKVQARMRQGITLDRFTEAVTACTTMPFLLGTNKNGWVASFDWLIENDRNLLKVLEGNYKDVGGTIRGTNQFSSPTLEREQRSNSAIADARETLRRNLGLDGADEEQLPIAGDQFIDGSGVDGALDEAGPGTRVATIQGGTVEAF